MSSPEDTWTGEARPGILRPGEPAKRETPPTHAPDRPSDVLQAAREDPVPGETRRAPPGWKGWLREIGAALMAPDTDTETQERGRVSALCVMAHRRRWREQDAIVRELRRTLPTQAPIMAHFTDADGRDLVRTEGAAVELDGECHFLELMPPLTREERELRDRHGQVVTPRGRWLPVKWGAYFPELAGHLATCRRGWVPQVRADGSTVEVPHGCKSIVCPVCNHERRQDKIRAVLPEVEALLRAGCSVVMATNTQRTRPGEPETASLAVTARERREHGLHPCQRPRGATVRPVAGETLGEAWDRLDRALDVHRRSSGQVPDGDGETYRERWRAEVLGEVIGYEVTGYAGKAPRGRRVLRYHAHAHRLIVLAPWVDPETWAAFWSARWVEVADAGSSGQHHRVIADGRRPAELQLAKVAHAIRQVLKYPGKLDTMTTAQRLDFYASMKGRRPYRVRGIFHGADRRRQELLGALLAEGSIDDPWRELDADGLGAARRELAASIGSRVERKLAKPRAVCAWATRDGSGKLRPVTRGRAATWRHPRTLYAVPLRGYLEPQEQERLAPLGAVVGAPVDVARGIVCPVTLGEQGVQLGEDLRAFLGGELAKRVDQPPRDARRLRALCGGSLQGAEGAIHVPGEVAPGLTVDGAPPGFRHVPRDFDRGLGGRELGAHARDRGRLAVDRVESPIEPGGGGIGEADQRGREDLDGAIFTGRASDGSRFVVRVLIGELPEVDAERCGGGALAAGHELHPREALPATAREHFFHERGDVIGAGELAREPHTGPPRLRPDTGAHVPRAGRQTRRASVPKRVETVK